MAIIPLPLNGMSRHIIPISGKDSLATAIVQTTNFPSIDYRYIFNDVGSELPETYEWVNVFSDWLLVEGFPVIEWVKYKQMGTSRQKYEYSTLEEESLVKKTFASKSIRVFKLFNEVENSTNTKSN